MARNTNRGVRKRCACPRKKWSECKHPWHFGFKWNGAHYRFSLDREVGRAIESRSGAETEADRIRGEIRAGTFRLPTTAVVTESSPLTFTGFTEIWKERRGAQLVQPQDNYYRLVTIAAFPLPGQGSLTFGEKPLTSLTTDDIEAFRDWRKAQGLSATTVNHDLKLLRKMLNWGIRKGYLEKSPFKIGTEPAISLEREIPRDKRFQKEDDEQRLLNAAKPHLRSVIIALLDTACRPGEILSLQWRDVNMERRELTIRAENEKTRTARLVPISSRLRAVLEMRRVRPDGEAFAPDDFVFGDPAGRRRKSVHTAWVAASKAAGLDDLQLRDLRHEAGSRFDEAGVSINYVSKILGHTNLATTSRYLNIHGRGLEAAMQKLEEHQEVVAQTLHKRTPDRDGTAPAVRVPTLN